MAMREDGSNRSPLPGKFVVDLIAVLQTTSVPVFNETMKAFHASLNMERLKSGESRINTLPNLQQTFTFAKNYYKELFNESIWYEATMEQAKSTFVIYWRNRCWNCKKENCSTHRCIQPIDRQQIESNKQEWMKETRKTDPSTEAVVDLVVANPPRIGVHQKLMRATRELSLASYIHGMEQRLDS
jgi:hypothetical protein